jgi:hypothetical protein
MKTFNFLLIPVFVFGMSVLTASCSLTVTESVSVPSLTGIAEDEIQAALISDDIDNELDTYVSDSFLSQYIDSTATTIITIKTAGPTITIDKPDTIYPKTFTLDYGTTGTTLANGNIVKGKIIAFVNTDMKLNNSIRKISLVDFSENGDSIKGSKTITYMRNNLLQLPYWSINVKDTVTRPDGSKIFWNSKRQRVLSGNNNTPLIYSDDIYSISGTSEGVSANGTPFGLEIRNNYPLVIGGNWPFYIRGITSLTIKNGNIAIDYGNGTKDKAASVIVNGQTSSYTFQY